MGRPWRSPIMPARAASAGIAFCTALEPATSAWRVMAPISTALPETLIAESSLIVPRSSRWVGEDSRSLMACTGLSPPARKRASVLPLINATASFELAGRWYSNACMAILLKIFPNRLRRCRHGQIPDAEGVGDGINRRRGRADRTRFAAALHAERLVGAGGFARVELERGHVARPWDAVIAERAGQQLTALVVLAAFGERLADALRQAAVHLALDDHRIDDLAEVVHRDKRGDLGFAGVAVDLHLADVGAGREGEIGRVVERVLVQPGLELVERVVVRHVGGEGHLAEGLLLVGAGDLEHAAVVLDVALGGLHQVRRDLLALGHPLVERLDDGGAADRDRARAVGAHAEQHLGGVAVHGLDLLHAEAEAVGHYLRERRLGPLAVRMRAGEHRHDAGRVQGHFARLEPSRRRAEAAR